MADKTLDRYRENVGHEPLPCPDEYAWQWTYRGRPGERELLADLLEEEHKTQPSPEQDSLF